MATIELPKYQRPFIPSSNLQTVPSFGGQIELARQQEGVVNTVFGGLQDLAKTIGYYSEKQEKEYQERVADEYTTAATIVQNRAKVLMDFIKDNPDSGTDKEGLLTFGNGGQYLKGRNKIVEDALKLTSLPESKQKLQALVEGLDQQYLGMIQLNDEVLNKKARTERIFKNVEDSVEAGNVVNAYEVISWAERTGQIDNQTGNKMRELSAKKIGVDSTMEAALRLPAEQARAVLADPELSYQVPVHDPSTGQILDYRTERVDDEARAEILKAVESKEAARIKELEARQKQFSEDAKSQWWSMIRGKPGLATTGNLLKFISGVEGQSGFRLSGEDKVWMESRIPQAEKPGDRTPEQSAADMAALELFNNQNLGPELYRDHIQAMKGLHPEDKAKWLKQMDQRDFVMTTVLGRNLQKMNGLREDDLKKEKDQQKIVDKNTMWLDLSRRMQQAVYEYSMSVKDKPNALELVNRFSEDLYQKVISDRFSMADKLKSDSTLGKFLWFDNDLTALTRQAKGTSVYNAAYIQSRDKFETATAQEVSRYAGISVATKTGRVVASDDVRPVLSVTAPELFKKYGVGGSTRLARLDVDDGGAPTLEVYEINSNRIVARIPLSRAPMTEVDTGGVPKWAAPQTQQKAPVSPSASGGNSMNNPWVR